NGIEKEWELRELLQYIRNHTASYKVCTVQIANLLNSNKVEMKVREKSKILLHEISDPKQILLSEGQLLTIKKVPVFMKWNKQRSNKDDTYSIKCISFR